MILDGVSVVEAAEGVAASSAGAALRRLGACVTQVPLDWPVRAPLTSGERRLMEILDAGKERAAPRAPGAGFWALAAEADIVICDISRSTIGARDESIADYVDLVARANRSSWVTVSPFGLVGPNRTFLGGELVAVCAGGVAAYMRSSRGRPMKPAGYTSLITAGHFAALAGLHGLHILDRGGGPAHMDLSVQDTVLVSGTFLECAHLLFGCPGRGGTSRYSAPKGLARCRDGLVLIVIIEDHQWLRLKEALGDPAWATGIDTREQRREHSAEIQRRFEEWTAQYTVAECTEILQAAGVPVTAVSSGDDLLADPDLHDRGFFETWPDGTLVPSLPAVVTPRPPRAETVAHRPRVLDLSQVLAGPLATSWLGAMGLDVVKVEDPQRIDVYRRGGPFEGAIEDIERSVYFSAANYSKRSVRLDPGTAEGARTLGELVAAADYVVENMSEKRAAAILPDDLRTSSGISVISSSGFGRRRARRHGWRAYGHNIHAHGGLVDLSRDVDEQPRDLGTSWGDPLTGVWIALFAMAATSARAVSRPDVDLSMVEVVACEFPDFLVAAQRGGPRAARESRLDGFAPHGVFACAGTESWLAVAVSADSQWEALLDVLGRPATLTTARFATAEGRESHQDELERAVEAVTRERDRDELAVLLQAAGVAAFPVMDAPRLIEDGHLRRRGLFQPVWHSVWNQRRLTALPWRPADPGADAAPIRIQPPPLFGEHTHDVQREWLGKG